MRNAECPSSVALRRVDGMRNPWACYPSNRVCAPIQGEMKTQSNRPVTGRRTRGESRGPKSEVQGSKFDVQRSKFKPRRLEAERLKAKGSRLKEGRKAESAGQGSKFDVRRSKFSHRCPAAVEYLSRFLCVGYALALLATGCAGPRPLKGGKAVITRTPAGIVEQSLTQSENPAQATKQDQETVKVRSYTVPAGSRVETGPAPGAATALPTAAPASGQECPMPLGIGIGLGEFLACDCPGAYEFGDIFLEGTHGARFGRAGLAALG